MSVNSGNSDMIDDETESRLDGPVPELYDVSEMSHLDSDDDVSVMSFTTINQDKYFIPPDANLDDVMEKLLAKKSKHVLKQERE